MEAVLQSKEKQAQKRVEGDCFNPYFNGSRSAMLEVKI